MLPLPLIIKYLYKLYVQTLLYLSFCVLPLCLHGDLHRQLRYQDTVIVGAIENLNRESCRSLILLIVYSTKFNHCIPNEYERQQRNHYWWWGWWRKPIVIII